MIKIIDYHDHGTLCPSQWTCYDDSGYKVYIRYRWGVLSVMYNGEEINREVVGDSLSGTMSFIEMRSYLLFLLDFSNARVLYEDPEMDYEYGFST